jgi:hypothetical protein
VRTGDSHLNIVAAILALMALFVFAAIVLVLIFTLSGQNQQVSDALTPSLALTGIPPIPTDLPTPTVAPTITSIPVDTLTFTPWPTHTRVPRRTSQPATPVDTAAPIIQPSHTATITEVPLTNTPSLTPTLTFTPLPPGITLTPTPTSAPTPSLNSGCGWTADAADACSGKVKIQTVDYEDALVSTPGFPYPRVDFARLGGIDVVTYDTLILENDSLRLTFLPALGGRLYQITDKTTGQDMLYNNPVITPTHWGPPNMQWWLEIGGIEWAFPVEEHGYAWGLPWEATTDELNDGSATITLSFSETVKHLDVMITVTLPASGRAFIVTTALTSTSTKNTAVQFWNNAALMAGPGMRAELPTSNVEVHGAGLDEGVQAGQMIGWDANRTEWGAWREWISAFAAGTNDSSVRMRGAGSHTGLLRTFDQTVTPGVKFFAFGPYSTVPNEYNGLPDFEVWGGITEDFTTWKTLTPGQQILWSEVWATIDW